MEMFIPTNLFEWLITVAFIITTPPTIWYVLSTRNKHSKQK